MREQAGEGQRERGRDRESQAGFIHDASAELNVGLNLMNEIMTLAEMKSWTLN